jgi:uncharacterized protein YyaL (SSP411 family)
MAQKILQGADKVWGGFGNAPKFPQTFSMQLLLRNYALNQDTESLEQVVFSLDKMIQGGIYDQLGGGFSRYSTDAQWQAPHFEKMLYDNALLLNVLAEAYQITKKEQYAIIIQETIAFLCRELSNGADAFYAALDADSEGVEGKFYTWTYEELRTLIDPDFFEFFCSYYQITPEGNWEHRNILWTLGPVPAEKREALQRAKKTLFAARAHKIRPSLDHKIILSWNNLLIIGLCKSFAALGLEEYRQQAIRTMQWLETNLFNELENYFYHTNTNGVKKTHAFLEDYATLIQAYIQLQEITGDTTYLYKAKKWMEYVQAHFIDEQNVFFYFTAAYQKDVIVRKKDNYDGAQPSGNAMIASALHYLGMVFDQVQWVDQSKQMVRSMRKLLLQYPSSFGYWGQCFFIHAVGFTELVGIGPSVQKHLIPVLKAYLPQKMVVFLPVSDPYISITRGKQSAENQYFICKEGTCSPAISNLSDFLALF